MGSLTSTSKTRLVSYTTLNQQTNCLDKLLNTINSIRNFECSSSNSCLTSKRIQKTTNNLMNRHNAINNKPINRSSKVIQLQQQLKSNYQNRIKVHLQLPSNSSKVKQIQQIQLSQRQCKWQRSIRTPLKKTQMASSKISRRGPTCTSSRNKFKLCRMKSTDCNKVYWFRINSIRIRSIKIKSNRTKSQQDRA